MDSHWYGWNGYVIWVYMSQWTIMNSEEIRFKKMVKRLGIFYRPTSCFRALVCFSYSLSHESPLFAGFYKFVKQEFRFRISDVIFEVLALFGFVWKWDWRSWSSQLATPSLRVWWSKFCTCLQFWTSCLLRFSCCTAKRTIHQSTGFWQSQTKIW